MEVTDEALFGIRPNVVYADKNNIFIRSGVQIYRYDKEGKFLNRIGTKGNGPHEINRLWDVSIDTLNQKVYAYVGNQNIEVFGFDGQPVESIMLKSEDDITRARLLGNRIVAEAREYAKDGSLTVSIVMFDLDGQETYKKRLHNFSALKVSYLPASISYVHDGHIIYKDIYSGASYRISEDSVNNYFYFDLGALTPDRAEIEDYTKKQQKLNRIAEIVDINEDNNYVYCITIKERTIYGFVYDKSGGNFVYANELKKPQDGGGIPAPGLKDVNFWPTFISSDGTKYSVIDVTETEAISEIASNGKRFANTTDCDYAVIIAR